MPYTEAEPLPVKVMSGGGGGGGSLSAKANAALQTSTEGATADPLSMDLSRRLRVTDEQVLATLASILTANTDTSTINVAQDTAVVKSGAASLTPKFAKISTSTSADIVALVASKKIRVLALSLMVTTAVTAKFQSGGTSDLTGAYPLGVNGGIVLPFCPVGHFETAAGEKLNLVLGSGVAVAGAITYVEV